MALGRKTVESHIMTEKSPKQQISSDFYDEKIIYFKGIIFFALVTAVAITAMALLYFLSPAALSLLAMATIVALPLTATGMGALAYLSNLKAAKKRIDPTVVVPRSIGSNCPKERPVNTHPERAPNRDVINACAGPIETITEETEEQVDDENQSAPQA